MLFYHIRCYQDCYKSSFAFRKSIQVRDLFWIDGPCHVFTIKVSNNFFSYYILKASLRYGSLKNSIEYQNISDFLFIILNQCLLIKLY